MAVRHTGNSELGTSLFDAQRLYRDVANGVLSRLTGTEVDEVVEDTIAAIERDELIEEALSPEERVQFPTAVGWVWDKTIAEEVERQLQRRDRMAIVLYALSTRGRRDREGRSGWSDARQVLSWVASRYPDLGEVGMPERRVADQQTWIHPGAPAPHPGKLIKRSRTARIRERQQAFDYPRFKRSIRLAVVGRFDELERDRQIDLVAEWVMWGLAGQETVLSSQLAAGVLDCLRRVDDIAFLRWTAFVKGVDSVTEFADEARGLLRYPSPRLLLTGATQRGRDAPATPSPPMDDDPLDDRLHAD